MRRLLLWDIDGTVLRGGGVGSRILRDAAAAVAGLADVPDVDMDGKTDPQILRDVFLAAEVDAHALDSLVPEAIAACETRLAAAEAELRAKGEVLPGVRPLLERLADTEGVRQTLLTGNGVGNAAIKMAAFELSHLFDAEVGAYGTDHADRLELVPIALERAERLRGERYDPSEVWVIGDTPNDLACARAGGVRCLLVGTGLKGLDSVRHLDAECVLEDLSDHDAVFEVLTS